MWPNTQEAADLVTFNEEILNGKLYFCAVCNAFYSFYLSVSDPFYLIVSYDLILFLFFSLLTL